jgi:hypothetical protein
MNCIAYCISGKNMDWMGKTFSPYINYWGRLAVGKHSHLKMGKWRRLLSKARKWGRLLSKAPQLKMGALAKEAPPFKKTKNKKRHLPRKHPHLKMGALA